MTKLDNLRQAANEHREVFFKRAQEIPDALRPARIVDDALHAFDPEFKSLKTMQARATNNPFALIAALAGAFLLARQLSTKLSGSAPGSSKPEPSKGVRRSRLAHITTKGEYHGDHISSKL